MDFIVQAITKKYGAKTVLSNISFEARQGEIIGLLGANGVGKSTLIKIMTGLENPTQGKILFFDKTLEKNKLHLQRGIGYLPESNPLYDWMYVKEYLYFVAKLHKSPLNMIQETMEALDITSHQKMKISTLSKGYKQRVGLAASILHQPHILFLDEPFNGLDPLQMERVSDFIKKYAWDKILFFSSHIISEIQNLCSRVLVLKEGELTADESISEGIPTKALELMKHHSP